MRVVLPDRTELELEDGATGLDAARAIGPKLAEQAVLVRTDGRVQDLRRRLYPGVKIAIGPPIENGFYYDFEFPEAVHEEDLERIEAEIGRELAEGRRWRRQELGRDEAKRYFAE